MHWIIPFVIIVVSPLILILSAIWLMEVLLYRDEVKYHQKMSYKEFLSIYTIAPDKWQYQTRRTDHAMFLQEFGYVEYRTRNKHCYDRYDIYMKSRVDCLWLESFFKTKKTKKINNELIREKYELIEAWRRDIEEYKNTEEE